MEPFKIIRTRILSLVSAGALILLTSCATQPKPTAETTTATSVEQQQSAQKQALEKEQSLKLVLKRKVAIGRVSNETIHGRSFLRDNHGDPLGKQVSDMLSQSLIESGLFLVIERPDIDIIKAENDIANTELNIVGVDSLIMGSLIEFGRKTTGTKGFWSKSKKQTASAKVAIRLVNTDSGLAYFSATGSGEASTETGEVAFTGSTASYNGELNDRAIANAVSDLVDELINRLADRPWSTFILSTKNNNIFISGGERQGIHAGMLFDVETVGEKIKSPQTGFLISLPNKKIATIKVTSTFGDSETNEGSIAQIISGSIKNHNIKNLKVSEHATVK